MKYKFIIVFLLFISCSQVTILPTEQKWILDMWPLDAIFVFLFFIIIALIGIGFILFMQKKVYESYVGLVRSEIMSITLLKEGLSKEISKLISQINESNITIEGLKEKNQKLYNEKLLKDIEWKKMKDELSEIHEKFEMEKNENEMRISASFESKMREMAKQIKEIEKDSINKVEKIAELIAQRDMMHRTLYKYGINVYEIEKDMKIQVEIWTQRMMKEDINSVLFEITDHSTVIKDDELHQETTLLLSRKYGLDKNISERIISAENILIEKAKITSSLANILNRLKSKY
jgi:hypothetical protein